MNYCLNCNKRTISPHCEHVDKGLEITKTSFNAKIIAAESDGKNIQGINLRKQFGFDPEIIILERLITEKNTFVVRAMLPEDLAKEIEKQEKDWTVVLRVPAKNWDNMAYLRGIKDSGDVTVIIKTKG